MLLKCYHSIITVLPQVEPEFRIFFTFIPCIELTKWNEFRINGLIEFKMPIHFKDTISIDQNRQRKNTCLL